MVGVGGAVVNESNRKGGYGIKALKSVLATIEQWATFPSFDSTPYRLEALEERGERRDGGGSLT